MSSFCLRSQDYQFYFGANHYFSSTESTSRTFNGVSYLSLFGSDSLFQRTLREVETRYENVYTNVPGILVGVNMDWKIGSRLSVRTGLGISSTSTRFEQKYIGSETISLTVLDTVTLDFPNTGFSDPCQFTNSIVDVGEADPYTRFTIYALQIPLKLNYQLTDKLGIVLGGVLRTPIASSRRTESINLVNDFNEAGEQTCTYVLQKNNDHTGRELRNLTVQAELELYYWLGNIGVSLGGGKMFSNLFVSADQPFYSPSTRHSAPYTAQVKVLYRFGEKE